MTSNQVWHYSRMQILECRPEIERSILSSVRSVTNRDEPAQQSKRLKQEVRAIIDFVLFAVLADAPFTSIPDELLHGARGAALREVRLDLVLRRIWAGFEGLRPFLIDSPQGPIDHRDTVSQRLNAALGFVVEEVGSEYERSRSTRVPSVEDLRALSVERALRNPILADLPDLRYVLDGWHVGLVSPTSLQFQDLSALVKGLDRSALVVPRSGRSAWAWIGGRRPFVGAELDDIVAALDGLGANPLGVGVPSLGPEGWRLTHRQSLSALSFASRSERTIVRYGDDPVVISAAEDDLLASSLSNIYLRPLENARDGGQAVKETLRAYLSSGGNVSAAAAALGVNRGTVSNRLASVEALLGRRVAETSADLQIALALDQAINRGAMTKAA